MIVPEYWAEARIQKRFPDRQVTVRRFGWSDDSQEAAQQHANDRVQEAFDRIVNGEPLPRRERRVRYNGVDGLPIREEIVDRLNDCVITRNSYGARCLNTPDVFFADVDQQRPAADSCQFNLFCLFIGLFGTGLAINQTGNIFPTILWLPFIMLGATVAAIPVNRVKRWQFNEPNMLRRIENFVRKHPSWHLRIYRTPNGFRLLAMHQEFDPRSEEVERAFKAFKVDRTYQVMCQKQNCFRARLTAKPWRIGISDRLKPRPGVWPIREERLPGRNVWIREYESSAANFSACRYVTSVGPLMSTTRKTIAVRDYHDDICRANDELELA